MKMKTKKKYWKHEYNYIKIMVTKDRLNNKNRTKTTIP